MSIQKPLYLDSSDSPESQSHSKSWYQHEVAPYRWALENPLPAGM